jgi:hypothetical protein
MWLKWVTIKGTTHGDMICFCVPPQISGPKMFQMKSLLSGFFRLFFFCGLLGPYAMCPIRNIVRTFYCIRSPCVRHFCVCPFTNSFNSLLCTCIWISSVLHHLILLQFQPLLSKPHLCYWKLVRSTNKCTFYKHQYSSTPLLRVPAPPTPLSWTSTPILNIYNVIIDYKSNSYYMGPGVA